jgi:phospholipase C
MMKKTPLSVLLLSALYAHNSYAQTATTTPIEHVIVLVGENRTFDNLYGVYQPKKKQTISNLWSKGIVKADGSPGPNYHLAAQKTAENFTAYPDANCQNPLCQPAPAVCCRCFRPAS